MSPTRTTGRSRRSIASILAALLMLLGIPAVTTVVGAGPAWAVNSNQFAWPATGHTDANDVAWHRANENGARAVDIQAATGTHVYAAQSGVVVTASNGCANSNSWGCGHGFGNYVVIRHDRTGVATPLYTLYGHLNSSLAVSVNQSVSVGSDLGYIALSGSTTGAHTHFAIGTCSTPWSNGAAYYDTNCTVWSGSDTTSTTVNQGSAVPGTYSQLEAQSSQTVVTNMFYLNNNFDTQHDIFTSYGNYGDGALVGDWDGNGTTTLGVRQDNVYYLNNNFDGQHDISVAYGDPNITVVAGDWDGNGTQTLAVRYNNTFYFDNQFDGVADFSFSYGNAGDLVLAGDWDGDGDDTLAVRQNNVFYFDNGLDGVADFSLSYGSADWPAVAGDWDGDGDDGIAVRYTNIYYLDYNLDGTADLTTSYGDSNDHPIAGDWDGNGTDTLGIRQVDQS